jgi:hypothetical protein
MHSWNELQARCRNLMEHVQPTNGRGHLTFSVPESWRSEDTVMPTLENHYNYISVAPTATANNILVCLEHLSVAGKPAL